MRHVFIINPAAGKHQNACSHVDEIRAVFADDPRLGTPEILYTEEPGHATKIAEQFASSGEPVRIYACGGDGTVSEVLQGIHRYDNAELAIFPCGSANDYIRSFPEHDFFDLNALVHGDVHEVDLIRCDDVLSLNIACMGMDADVASKMVKYKHWPLVSGPMAYNIAIADVFFHRIGKDLTVTVQTTHGEETRKGRFLFALAASGQYYGGGYRGAPDARIDDGILDFVLVSAMSRAKILRFLPDYKKGTVQDNPYVETLRGTSMTVHCDEGAVVALDGEIYEKTDITFSLYEKSIRFVLPQQAVVKQPIFEKVPVRGKQKALSGAFVKKI
ncbi:MAG: hypothetical protein IJB27_04895 [Clostridia bacterium]|nr:hypothetical protein [Clostridia bacterium]